MLALNFVWPDQVHPAYQARIESGLLQTLDQVGAEDTLCHHGIAEVNLAYGTPRGSRINAVLVCSCGKPRAALEGVGNGVDQWTFQSLLALRSARRL